MKKGRQSTNDRKIIHGFGNVRTTSFQHIVRFVKRHFQLAGVVYV